MSDQFNAQHDPERLLANFNRPVSQIIVFFTIAFVLHLVVIAGSSPGYIRDRWVDPEGAKLRDQARIEQQKKEEAERNQKAADADTAKPKPPETDNNSVPPEGDGADGPKKGSVERENEALLKTHGDSKVVQKITEMPKEGEIPAEPDKEKPLDDELGIKFDETDKTVK